MPSPQAGDRFRITQDQPHFKPERRVEYRDLVQFVSATDDDEWIVQLLEPDGREATSDQRRIVSPAVCRAEKHAPAPPRRPSVAGRARQSADHQVKQQQNASNPTPTAGAQQCPGSSGPDQASPGSAASVRVGIQVLPNPARTPGDSSTSQRQATAIAPLPVEVIQPTALSSSHNCGVTASTSASSVQLPKIGNDNSNLLKDTKMDVDSLQCAQRPPTSTRHQDTGHAQGDREAGRLHETTAGAQQRPGTSGPGQAALGSAARGQARPQVLPKPARTPSDSSTSQHQATAIAPLPVEVIQPTVPNSSSDFGVTPHSSASSVRFPNDGNGMQNSLLAHPTDVNSLQSAQRPPTWNCWQDTAGHARGDREAGRPHEATAGAQQRPESSGPDQAAPGSATRGRAGPQVLHEPARTESVAPNFSSTSQHQATTAAPLPVEVIQPTTPSSSRNFGPAPDGHSVQPNLTAGREHLPVMPAFQPSASVCNDFQQMTATATPLWMQIGKLCDECENIPATSYCEDCKQPLCEDCWQFFHSGDVSSTHMKLAIPETVSCSKCATHTADVQCLDCNAVFCYNCNMAEHQERSGNEAHKRHNLPGRVPTFPTCTQCKECPADWMCQECGSSLCQACDGRVHKKSTRATHKRQRLQPPESQQHLEPGQLARGHVTATRSFPISHSDQTAMNIGVSPTGGQAQRHGPSISRLDSTSDTRRTSAVRPGAYRNPLSQTLDTLSLKTLLEESLAKSEFQVMPLLSLCTDYQDAGTSVEKALVSPEAFNDILAQYGFDQRDGKEWLSNQGFQQKHVTTIGLYGNTTLIGDWLSKNGVLAEDTSKRLVQDSKPGLYCLSNGTDVQLLVLVPPQQAFPDVSSDNICCNLVRYLVELCNQMVIPFGESDQRMFETTPFSQQQAEHRFSMSIMDKEEREDGITVGAGFKLQIQTRRQSNHPLGENIDLCHSSEICCLHVSEHVQQRGRRMPPEMLQDLTSEEASKVWREKTSIFRIQFGPKVKRTAILKFFQLVDPDRPELLEYNQSKLKAEMQQGGTRLRKGTTEHRKFQESVDERHRQLIRGTVDKLQSHCLGTPGDRLDDVFQMEILKLDISQSRQPLITIQLQEQSHLVVEYVEKLHRFHPTAADVRRMDNSLENIPKTQLKVCASRGNIPLNPRTDTLLRVYNLKNGKILAIIQNRHGHNQESTVVHILPEKDHTESNGLPAPLFSIDGPVSLVDFDESTCLVAFCLPVQQKVQIYKFDADYDDWQLVSSVILRVDSHVLQLLHLLIVPKKDQLCLITPDQKCYVCYIQQEVVGSCPIVIDEPVGAALVTLDGVLLLTFTITSANNVVMHAYSISSLEKVETIRLECSDFPADCIDTLRLVNVGRNMFLVGLNRSSQTISSRHLCIRANGVVTVNQAGEVQERTASNYENPNYLDYLYHALEKFCTTDGLGTSQPQVSLHCLLDFELRQTDILPQQYISELLRHLQKVTNKDMRRIQKMQETMQVLRYRECGKVRHELVAGSLTDWLKQLICLIPLQIARAENDSFTILTNGLNLGREALGEEAGDLEESIQLGLYEEIISNWKGPVKVLSSMGKQSTGKSYMLNHVTGALFDISGGRCTDGVWMTVRETEGCLYVVLDFEGLGSSERRGQEDVLLSVMNAAISGMTIFKVDNRFDRDLRALLNNIKNGVHFIRGDPKLLRGLIVFTIKDISSSGTASVTQHFNDKITEMCLSEENNFIKQLYESKFGVYPFPVFGTEEFHSGIKSLANRLQSDITPSFQSGTEFMSTLKMLMVKLHNSDPSPFDEAHVRLRVVKVQRQLQTALEYGVGTLHGTARSLESAGREPVAEEVITVAGGLTFPGLADAGLQLPAGILNEADWTASVAVLAEKFSTAFGRKRNEGNERHAKQWKEQFQQFLLAVVERREKSITEWWKSYFRAPDPQPVPNSQQSTATDPDEFPTPIPELTALGLEIKSKLEKLKSRLVLCRVKCLVCELPCMLWKYHAGDQHSCLGNHRCYMACHHCVNTPRGRREQPDSTYTAKWWTMDEKKHVKQMRLSLDTETVFTTVPDSSILQSEPSWQCWELAGHPTDQHNCKVRPHMCREACHLKNSWRKCSQTCNNRQGHDGPHLCIGGEAGHLCKLKCRLVGCQALCKESYSSLSSHTLHGCEKSQCLQVCEMPNCQRVCASSDHFHGTSRSVRHQCNEAHQCREKCDQEGFCEVLSRVNGKPPEGKMTTRANVSIKFSKFPDKNVSRSGCVKPIPSGQRDHSGRHACERKVKEHTCVHRCEYCDYTCEKPLGHSGRCCVPVHGNMRKAKVVVRGSSKSIKVDGHEYTSGDTGEAETCDKCCKVLGRGHTHFKKCENECRGRSSLTGIRHFEGRTDELTHAAFWKSMGPKGFEEPPSSASDAYGLCSALCPEAQSHIIAGEEKAESHCNFPLWHDPPTDKQTRNNDDGFFTADGHHFTCSNHGLCPIHHILVLDKSWSMSSKDQSRHKDRAAAVLAASHDYMRMREKAGKEDIVSAVVFSTDAGIVFSGQRLEPDELKRQLETHLVPDGLTNFTAGLRLAEVVLRRNASTDRNVLVLFLSDGEMNEGVDDFIQVLNSLLSSGRSCSRSHVRMHTVVFGGDDEPDAEKLLRLMAELARNSFRDDWSSNSSFEKSVSGIALVRHFVGVAKSLDKGGFRV